MKILLIIILLACRGACMPAEQTEDLLPRVLHPAYQDWLTRPGEMYGFWLWTGPGALKDQIARTGANATSMHLTMGVMEAADSPLKMKPAPFGMPDTSGVPAGVGIGEHNNPFFVRYPDWFWKLRQEAQMRDKDGKVIRAGTTPVPAMDDPVLAQLAYEQMTDMVRLLGGEPWVRYWVIAGEQSWPDYFGLPEGDYRPASRRHFQAWKELRDQQGEPGKDRTQWREFRESVFADRYAAYTAHLRKLDPSRLITIPTHGNPFTFDFRAKMGYPLADMAGAADGFEAGPISIDDDAERLIRMTLDQQTSFGIPVVAPRLANKQLDPKAKGGGRGFSPESLRRTVYEALGMGVRHIGLVHWIGDLHDGEWGIINTPAEGEAKRVFEELRLAGTYLDGCSRLQPQVGIYISDASWRRWWQDRWTLLYDQAVSRGWSVIMLTDAQIGPELAAVTPVLVSVDNPVVSQEALDRLKAYMRAGGKIISVGAQDIPGVLAVPDDAAGLPVKIIHQTQTTKGANTWTVEAKPLPMDALEKAVSRYSDIRPISLIDPMGQMGHMGPMENLLLTDGTNVFAVLINRSSEQQEVEIKPSSQLEKRLGRWTARNLLTGEMSAKVSIEPYGSALISLEPMIEPQKVESEIKKAEEAVSRWSKLGIDVSHFQETLIRIHEHRDAGRTSKAYALTRSITHSIELKSTVRYDGKNLRMQVKAWTSEGERASGAQVRMRLVPGSFAWQQLKETSPGVFELQIPKENLPLFYNPVTEKCEIAHGATQVVFDAALGNTQGGTRSVVSLE